MPNIENLTNMGKGRPRGAKNKIRYLTPSLLAEKLGISHQAAWKRIHNAGFESLEDVIICLFENWEHFRGALKELKKRN